jgi:hypothetical protein
MAPASWTSEMRFQLLFAVMAKGSLSISKADFEGVAAMMGCNAPSASAC